MNLSKAISRATCAGAMVLAVGTLAAQQSTPPGEMTIGRAVGDALRNYPSIRVTQEQMNAAAAAIRLAQTAYLPRVDGLAQVNRATRNTFYGMLLPQGVIPGVDGVPANNLGSVWDSGVGLLVTWQPFDFGLRAANVAAATAARNLAQAAMNRTRYDVSVATADAFLTVIAAQQTAQAARASVDSWQILLKSIHALVAAELRPGADESRVRAELAAAQTQVAQAEQAIDVARSTRGAIRGARPVSVECEPRQVGRATAAGSPGASPGDCAKPGRDRAERRDRAGDNPNSRRSNGRIIRNSPCRAWPPRAGPACSTTADGSAG